MARASVHTLAGSRRILLYGVTGSGKSTAAQHLAAALGLPLHLVDDEIGWLPGWTERAPAEQRELAAAVAAQPSWVLDSMYSSWRDLVLPRAQVVVALDYPRRVSLLRLLRRTVSRVVRRTVVCNGNVESARAVLSRRSILVWHFASFAAKRRRIRGWEADPLPPQVLRVRHPRELDDVLAHLTERRR